MKFFSISSFLVLNILLHTFTSHLTVRSHHVIFENIGQMAGALSYQHVKLTLNFSSIENQFIHYEAALQKLYTDTMARPEGPTEYAPARTTALIFNDNKAMNLKVIELYRKEAIELQAAVNNFRDSLPEVSSGPRSKRSILDTGRKIYKAAKTVSGIVQGVSSLFRAASLPFGILGTFIGLFQAHQIDNLRKELHETIEAHNRLVEVVQEQITFVQKIEKDVVDLGTVLRVAVLHNPGVTAARLHRIEGQIKRRLEIAIHTLQQAQHRRLAVDFLDSRQLQLLYSKLQEQAELNGCTLLINHRSDLFQLELSYFFDGADVHLLLHVPMVPNDSMLRLFRLHPFPLPLSGSHVLIPSVKDNILAISSGFKRYSVQLSTTDLLGCHVINNIYLCERHGVLNSNLNSTCLGSLYQQDFETVRRLCQLEVHKTGELVYQLLENWYLAYSPSVFTAPISCNNGTQSELHLKKGITKFNLSPGCRMHMQQHLVISDISMRVEADLLHFEWNWDDVSLGDLSPEVVMPLIAALEENQLTRPTLADLHELSLHQRRSPGWWATLVNFVGLGTLSLMFIALVIFLGVRLYRFNQAKEDNLNEISDRDSENQEVATAPTHHHYPNLLSVLSKPRILEPAN